MVGGAAITIVGLLGAVAEMRSTLSPATEFKATDAFA